MQPVIADFTRENHQCVGLEIQVNNVVLWVLEVHSRAALEAQGCKHLLERRMSINVRRDTLTWHIVIHCQLVEETKSLQGIIVAQLVGIERADKAIITKLEVLDGILKTYQS